MQAQAPAPAQVALAKPPVVPVPAAVVSSPGVTTLPVSVAGISVAIGQPQKAAGVRHTQPPLRWGGAGEPFPGGPLARPPGERRAFQQKSQLPEHAFTPTF